MLECLQNRISLTDRFRLSRASANSSRAPMTRYRAGFLSSLDDFSVKELVIDFNMLFDRSWRASSRNRFFLAPGRALSLLGFIPPANSPTTSIDFHLTAAEPDPAQRGRRGGRTRAEGFQNCSRTSSFNRVLSAGTLTPLRKNAMTTGGKARSSDFQPRAGSKIPPVAPVSTRKASQRLSKDGEF